MFRVWLLLLLEPTAAAVASDPIIVTFVFGVGAVVFEVWGKEDVWSSRDDLRASTVGKVFEGTGGCSRIIGADPQAVKQGHLIALLLRGLLSGTTAAELEWGRTTAGLRGTIRWVWWICVIGGVVVVVRMCGCPCQGV